jgi:hypothetical protein
MLLPLAVPQNRCRPGQARSAQTRDPYRVMPDAAHDACC